MTIQKQHIDIYSKYLTFLSVKRTQIECTVKAFENTRMKLQEGDKYYFKPIHSNGNAHRFVHVLFPCLTNGNVHTISDCKR